MLSKILGASFVLALFGTSAALNAYEDLFNDCSLVSHNRKFACVTEEELQDDKIRKQVVLRLQNESSVLFDHVSASTLTSVLHSASFPTHPNSLKPYFFAHKYNIPATTNYIYNTFVFDKFATLATNSERKHSPRAPHAPQQQPPDTSVSHSNLFITYKQDILNYINDCVFSTHSISSTCVPNKLLIGPNSWQGDQSGMLPANNSAVWGLIQQTVYLDDSSDSSNSTFESVIPYSFYMYAEANPATLALESIVLYVIAEGLHKTTPSCDDNTCRGFAHRQVWINCTAWPSNDTGVTPDTYHWIYSTPTTDNNEGSVTTSVEDTITLGTAGSIKTGMTFEHSYEWTNGYSESVSIDQFGVDEDSDPISAVGEWYYFQQLPFDISENEPWNFEDDWESWYSSTASETFGKDDCVIQAGPDLAFNSEQTSNAIRWAADPALIDYDNKAMNMDYGVDLIAEVDIVWCPDDPTNPNPGHHEVAYWILQSQGDYTANVIQAMNNIN